ncbi:MAG: flagellar filament capping protein FliD [Verrucomicrobia subdivision 3 bacterium]|nr:flagellar filament capping protein FliD [Limisphaerales bacterium]
MDLSLSGLASGFDWQTMVDQLIAVERAPEDRLRVEQTTLQQQNSAYTSIKTQLSVLQNRIAVLKEPGLFQSRQPLSSDDTIASATAGTGTTLGAYAFNFTQLATAAKQVGASGMGSSLSASNDVSSLVLSDAAFSTGVTEGKFTVNGKQITITTADTLQQVFDNISAATSGAVTGSYDAVSDRISLNSASPIVLGSATDSSNFLQVARLHNNGTGVIASSAQLGVIKQSASLSAANFATAISDGGAGAGEFKINGVSITYSVGDSAATLLKRINDSAAGVSAAYDTVNDRFVLSNKITGDIGLGLEDVTGNFLAATGLSGGTLERGQNLRYTIDGGSELISQSNTITESSSGIAGLSVTALAEGAATVTVSTDTAKIKTAINDFLTEYNKTQSGIDTQTASTTDAKGKVTAGILASDGDAAEIATRLRRLVTDQVAGLGTVLNQLEDMGIVSNGNDNTLKLDDETKLDAALANHLTTVETLFTDPTNGLAVKLNDYLEKTAGESGSLVGKQDNLIRAATDIDTQIADMERIILSNRQRMVDSFVAMETAQSLLNQQLKFLEQRFGTSSTSSS